MHEKDIQNSKASVCSPDCLECHDPIDMDFPDFQKSPGEQFGLLQTSLAKPMQQHSS